MKKLTINYHSRTELPTIGFTISEEQWFCVLTMPVVVYDARGYEQQISNFDLWLGIHTDRGYSEKSFRDMAEAFASGLDYNHSHRYLEEVVTLAIRETIHTLFSSEYAMPYAMLYDIEVSSPAQAMLKIKELTSKTIDFNILRRWWKYAKINNNMNVLNVVERIMDINGVSVHNPDYPHNDKYDQAIIEKVTFKLKSSIKRPPMPELGSVPIESIN